MVEFVALTTRINDVVEDIAEAENGGKGGRTHLGGSVIGKRCGRAIWYGWRWVYRVRHKGQLIRLWNRGELEEDRFLKYLRQAGLVISKTGHGTGQQKFSDFDGHFGGAGDGEISGDSINAIWPNAFDGDGLLECKTHGDKYFKVLKEKGVLSAHLSHYIQMQVYMGYFKLKWALYMGVNKNTDELYSEIVHFKQEVFDQYVDRAKKIIAARTAPPRISNDPSWWECKFCDFREICHHDALPRKNCRSCAFAGVDGPGWRCHKYEQLIPEDFIPKGCDAWEPVE